jgi:hypothetical protein
MDVRERLGEAAAGRLQQVVNASLGEPGAMLGEWDAAPLHWGPGMLAAERWLYLLTGTARVGAEERPWSLVLKVLTRGAGHDDPTRIGYWKREALLYRSGLLAALGAGLRAPHCYGCDAQSDGTIWLWLEHIREDGERVWPFARWALVARHLGQFNGAYLAGQPLPHAPWLGGRRLRTWLEGHSQRVRQIAVAPHNPAVRQWWPQSVVDAILRLWAERDIFCTALERLPQTFCHGDAIRRNLLTRRGVDGSLETVGIDWEYAGYMAAGEEVGQTLSVAGAFFDMDPADLPALDETLFAGYLDGLRDAGWQGDPYQVRLAYTAHAALRNLFNAVGTSMPEESHQAVIRQTWGHSLQELAGRRAAVRPFLLDRAQEAHNLLDRQ